MGSFVVTRQFALMRAHGLLRKLSSTHRYQLTAKGRRIISALHGPSSPHLSSLSRVSRAPFLRQSGVVTETQFLIGLRVLCGLLCICSSSTGGPTRREDQLGGTGQILPL